MNRRIAIVLFLISFILMACNCGGAGNAPTPAPLTPEQVAAQQKLQAEIDAAFAAEADAAKHRPAVNRERYNKVKNLMLLDDVQAILGPGKESSRSGRLMIVTWASPDNRCIISMTFESFANGWAVKSKTIIGD